MWYGIMKEFDCEVSSAWSECGTVKAEAFYEQAPEPRKRRENLAAEFASSDP